MENYEEDFVTEESVEFEIDGKLFKYKPTTADDELTWADEYIEIVDGKPKQNLKKITQCKIRNLIEVPYERALIFKIIDVDKDWKDLSNEEKLKFVGKLKPTTFDKIITKINGIDSPSKDVKKN